MRSSSSGARHWNPNCVKLACRDHQKPRDAGLLMLEKLSKRPRQTVGAYKGYDTKRFVQGCKERDATPHVAVKNSHGAVDDRATQPAGYKISLCKHKRSEKLFGWMKDIGAIRKLLHRGITNAQTIYLFNTTAFKLTRL